MRSRRLEKVSGRPVIQPELMGWFNARIKRLQDRADEQDRKLERHKHWSKVVKNIFDKK